MTIMNYYDNNKYKHNNVQSGDVSGRYYIYIYTYIHKLLNYSYVQINNTIDTSCDMARRCTVYTVQTLANKILWWLLLNYKQIFTNHTTKTKKHFLAITYWKGLTYESKERTSVR